jgi:hypothetical protein
MIERQMREEKGPLMKLREDFEEFLQIQELE